MCTQTKHAQKNAPNSLKNDYLATIFDCPLSIKVMLQRNATTSVVLGLSIEVDIVDINLKFTHST
jgi:hypothetical protein